MASTQSIEALARANKYRLARAELKKEIARGDVPITFVLGNPIPDWLEGMQIGELLRAQVRWGKTRSRKLLRQCAISEIKKIGTMTIRQRQLVVRMLQITKGSI